MGKGRNPLNYFGGVLLNWRAAENVACGDISKMFNRCETRDIDMHLRRFYVRPDGSGGKEPFRIAAIEWSTSEKNLLEILPQLSRTELLRIMPT